MNEIKFLATLTTEEINEAMQDVKGTDKTKARAIKEIEEYKQMRESVKKLFR